MKTRDVFPSDLFNMFSEMFLRLLELPGFIIGGSIPQQNMQDM